MKPNHLKRQDARQRLLETADRLFYAEGVRAVGIDRIITEAGVAKMSLYNHFASKDELILAVLQMREAAVVTAFTTAMDRRRAAGDDGLTAFFVALKEWFASESFRGCVFINTRVELADAAHPASQFAAAHKIRFRGMLQRIIAEGYDDDVAADLAPAVALLVDGAVVAAVMQQSPAPADVAAAAAKRLLGATGT